VCLHWSFNLFCVVFLIDSWDRKPKLCFIGKVIFVAQILVLRTVSLIFIHVAIWQDGYNYFTVARWFYMFLLGTYKLSFKLFLATQLCCGQSFHKDFDFLPCRFEMKQYFVQLFRFSKGHLVASKTVVKDLIHVDLKHCDI